MSGRKRKPDFADCDVTCLSPFADDCPAIEDITVHVKSQKAKGASKELTFRVQYIVKLTKPCCSNHKPNTRIDVMSTNACFIDDADPAIFMMNRTIAKIKQHKKDKKFDGIDLCDLDIKSGMGSYYMLGPSKPSVWRLLWSSAENEMNKERLASMIRTTKQVQQHKEKETRLKTKSGRKVNFLQIAILGQKQYRPLQVHWSYVPENRYLKQHRYYLILCQGWHSLHYLTRMQSSLRIRKTITQQ